MGLMKDRNIEDEYSKILDDMGFDLPIDIEIEKTEDQDKNKKEKMRINKAKEWNKSALLTLIVVHFFSLGLRIKYMITIYIFLLNLTYVRRLLVYHLQLLQ